MWRVLGCGVSGLTTATVLAETGHAVEIWARELPPETTSDVAPAYWHPYRAYPRDPVLRWAKASYDAFVELAGDVARTGIRVVPALQLSRNADEEEPWWIGVVGETASADPSTLAPEHRAGLIFEAPVVDTRRYLPYLIDRFERAGGTIRRRSVATLAEALEGARGVVNCCGLGARDLTDDRELYPIRGEIVRVANPGIERVVVDEHSPGGPSYIVPRGDECVLGGTALERVDDLTPDPPTQQAILERCRRLDRRLEGIEPSSFAVGLRPGRAGVRLEVEADASGKPCIHNYGHGGAGVTLSWGCAREVGSLVAAYSSTSSTAVP